MLEGDYKPNYVTVNYDDYTIKTGENYSVVAESSKNVKIYLDDKGNLFLESYYHWNESENFHSSCMYVLKNDESRGIYSSNYKTDKFIDCKGYNYDDKRENKEWYYSDLSEMDDNILEWKGFFASTLVSKTEVKDITDDFYVIEATIDNDENGDFAGVLSILISYDLPSDVVQINTSKIDVFISKSEKKIEKMEFVLDYRVGNSTKASADVTISYIYEANENVIAFPKEYQVIYPPEGYE